MAPEHDRYEVRRHRREGSTEVGPDEISREEPLEIRVGGRGVGITMRTPGHDEELAVGFLVGEGVVSARNDIEHVRRCDQSNDDVIDVIVSSRTAIDFARLTRHVFASSSCGICGSATIDAVRKQFAPLGAGPVVTEETIYALTDRLRGAQPTFDKTGGLHAAALFDASGELGPRLVLIRGHCLIVDVLDTVQLGRKERGLCEGSMPMLAFPLERQHEYAMYRPMASL